MVTRLTAGAFLMFKDKILLMKRGLHKKIAPGEWSGIGGHMDIEDITNPRELNLAETCYREVQEETGIAKHDIINLKLKYIATRKVGEEIRIHHLYFGEVKNELELPECEEGELHWINKKDISDLSMSLSIKTVLNHWISAPYNDKMFIIITNQAGDSAEILEL